MLKKPSWEVWLSLGFMSLGFIMIGVAWNGAASQDCIECQLPYVLSGGVGGLGLIILGAGLLLFIAGRRLLQRMEAKYDAILEVLRETAGLAAANGHASSNGKASAPQADQTLEGMVIIGRSSFHLPTCRLVEGKDEMDALPLEEAVARSLEACRVCDPLAPQTKTKPRAKASARRK